MPLLKRKQQFALKVEAVEGTAETLAAADVDMEVDDLDATFTPELRERRPLRNDLSATASVVGMLMGEITGRVELKPSLAPATTDPQQHTLLLACSLQQHALRTMALTGAPAGNPVPGEYILGGIAGTGFFIRVDGTTMMFVQLVAFVAAETITGTVSGFTATVHGTPAFTDIGKAYRPNSVNPPSFTGAQYMDGKRKLAFGARADATFQVGGVGQIGYTQFTLSGKMTQPTDVALLAGVSVPRVVPETFLGAQVKTVDLADIDLLCVDSFSLALNNTLARRACANEATGIISYRNTDRRPMITIDPEQELEAAINFFVKFAAGTQFGFYAQIGQTVGRRVIICAPRCQYQELGEGDRDNIATHTAQLLCCSGGSPGGDDDFIIAFG